MHLQFEGKSLLADLDLGHLAKLPAHATGELQPGTPPTQLAPSPDTLLATVEPPISRPKVTQTLKSTSSSVPILEGPHTLRQWTKLTNKTRPKQTNANKHVKTEFRLLHQNFLLKIRTITNKQPSNVRNMSYWEILTSTRWTKIMNPVWLFDLFRTYVTATTHSVIDKIISNHPGIAVSVVNTAISDQYGQEAIFSGVKLETESKITQTMRYVRPQNIAHLNNFLSKGIF
ncbi:hypothetical protein J6590_031258 [Homalodisca vitripennis]|nr:hypothetical protein J6590_031258 [Homalodisca vitripennis]